MKRMLVLVVAAAVPTLAGATVGAEEFQDSTTMSARGTHLKRPTSVPDDYELTPFGWAHPSCIVEVRDDQLYDAGTVVDPDGTRTILPPCSFPAYEHDGSPKGAHKSQQEGPAPDGWLASLGYWSASVWPDVVTATWVVPSNPAHIGNAYFYIFDGVETDDAAVIFQPVIQWQGLEGATGAWYGRSWRFEDNQHYAVSPAIVLLPGDIITGTVTGTNCSTSTQVCQSWAISLQVTRGQSNATTTLNTTPFDQYNVARDLKTVLGAAIEGYLIDSCSDFPQPTSLAFSSISVHQLGGSYITFPSWYPNDWQANQSPQCTLLPTYTSNSGTLRWCASGFVACGGACKNLQTDPNNCGTCGNVCPTGYSCSGGACVVCTPLPRLPTCYGHCGQTISDGCGGTLACPVVRSCRYPYVWDDYYCVCTQ